MASNRRQAIIGTNADPIYWRIRATLGGDELILETEIGILIFCEAKIKNRKVIKPVSMYCMHYFRFEAEWRIYASVN